MKTTRVIMTLEHLYLSCLTVMKLGGIKDTQSRFIYANPATLKLSGIPSDFDIEGRFDNECPADWAEYYLDLQMQDRKVENEAKKVAMLQTGLWGPINTLCEKFPLYNKKDDCIGTVYHISRYNFVSISDFFSSEIPPSLTFDPPSVEFTNREWEIIFFGLQLLSAKEIGKRLGLSHRTIENRLLYIYQKCGVNSLKGLSEFCKNKGYDRYIPSRLINNGCVIM